MPRRIEVTDYPKGDGTPDCPECKGRGVVDYQSPTSPVPGVLTCECVKGRDILLNMERGWRGLSRYKAIKKTPLSKYIQSNLRVTCSEKMLRHHLSHLAKEQGPRWKFNVFSDADLMDAWLSRVADDEIYDPDVEAIRKTAVSGRFLALVDLVEPPGLLILRVGVKAARNSAMPEVLLEALQHRSMVDKPTWVVDTPAYPLRTGHIAFDTRIGEYLEAWEHKVLETLAGAPAAGSSPSGGFESVPMGQNGSARPTLSSVTAEGVKPKKAKKKAEAETE